MNYLTDIDRFLLGGKPNEAINRINKILQDIELTDREKIKLNLLRSKSFLMLGEFDKGFDLSEEMLKLSKEKNFNLLQLESLILNVTFLLVIGKLDDILKQVYLGEQLICKLDNSSQEVQIMKGKLALLKGEIIQEKGNDNDAMNLFKETLNFFKKIDDKFEIAHTIYLIAKAYNDIGEKEKSLNLHLEALKLREEIGDFSGIANSLKEIGNFYLLRGFRDKALEYYQRSYDLNLNIGNIDLIGRLLNNIGIVHQYNGDLKKAEEYYERALEYQTKVGNKGTIASTYNNIGIMNLKMGNLTKAEDSIKKGLFTFQEIGRVQNIMNSLNQLGRIYILRGQFDEALLNFQLALNTMDQIPNQSFNSLTLYYYITAALLKGEIKDAKEKLEILKKIDLENDETYIHQRMKMATALLLKTSDRERNRGKAEEYFEELINNEHIESDMKSDAMLNLCELRISELKRTNNKELLEEVKILAQKILDTAEKENSMLLLAESYWLLSQISLIELDIRTAQEYLTKAQNLAQKWGIVQLAQKISLSHDMLLERLEIWESLNQKNAELPEIIETTDIEEFFKKLYLEKDLDLQFRPEEPIMFMLLKSSGVPIFSKNFVQTEELDDTLVSGFLSAIRFFAKEAFSVEGPIDRIKHNDYTIIINSFETYLVCYIFKGQSFSAIQKLTKLIDTIRFNEQIWNELVKLDKSSHPISDSSYSILDNLVSGILVSSI